MNGRIAGLRLDISCQHCEGTFSYALAELQMACPHCGQTVTRTEAILSFLRSAMATAFSFDRRQIKATSRLNEIGDSMGTIELLMRLEQDFGIAIQHDDIEDLVTVADVTQYIDSKVSQSLQETSG